MQTPNEIARYLDQNMLPVEGGTFEMGYKEGRDGEDSGWWGNPKPLHLVTLDSFYLGKYPVTQALYQALTGKNPSRFNYNPEHPVENVSWYDAVEFCNLLSEKTGLKPCYHMEGDKVTRIENADGYGLPSEAEWEYAARGGEHQAPSMFSGSDDLSEVGWFDENSFGETKPVGLKLPNALGLYGMSGNVWEWCYDWYKEYPESPQQNPIYEQEGTDRVIRGGGLGLDRQSCRVALRSRRLPDFRLSNVGFRLRRKV